MVPEISPLQAQKMLEEGKTVLLDVRHREEVEFTAIEPHIWIELSELPQRFTELPKEKEIICICRTGSRSATATDFLSKQGYKAANIKGGIVEWSKTRPGLKKYVYSWVGKELVVKGIRE